MALTQGVHAYPCIRPQLTSMFGHYSSKHYQQLHDKEGSQEHDLARLGPRYTSDSEQVQSWAYSVNHEEQPPEPGYVFEGPILSAPLRFHSGPRSADG